ncbi:hypothetical protein Tco_1149287 [Tanacetum coccineum]
MGARIGRKDPRALLVVESIELRSVFVVRESSQVQSQPSICLGPKVGTVNEVGGTGTVNSRAGKEGNVHVVYKVFKWQERPPVAIDGCWIDWSLYDNDEVHETWLAYDTFSDSKGSQITDKSRKGVGFVSYNTVPPPPTRLFSPLKFDLSNSGLEEFQQPEFEGYKPKPSKSFSEDTSNKVRESPDAPLVEELVLTTNYHQRERIVTGNSYTRVKYNYFAKKTHPSAQRNMVPIAILMKSGLKSLNTVRPVNTSHPKSTVYSARPMSHFSKSAQSTVKRPYQIRTTLTNKNSSQKVNTAKGKFYTARTKAVNTARPNSAVVNVVRANQGHSQKEDQVYVDSRCSRHMTGNMSYLSDFKEFDGGYVTFKGGAKGGKITGKGTLKTDV